MGKAFERDRDNYQLRELSLLEKNCKSLDDDKVKKGILVCHPPHTLPPLASLALVLASLSLAGPCAFTPFLALALFKTIKTIKIRKIGKIGILD